jgi:hypothetical protein
VTALRIQHDNDPAVFTQGADFVTGSGADDDTRDAFIEEAQARHFSIFVHEDGGWVAVNLHTMFDVHSGHLEGITYATAHTRDGDHGPITVAVAGEGAPVDIFNLAFGGRRGTAFVNSATDAPHTDDLVLG